MKIKVDELEGAALDWAVAQCEGEDYIPTPSGTTSAWSSHRRYIRWSAFSHDSQMYGLGPTQLIAAMRCYVKLCFGSMMDVPEHLFIPDGDNG